MSVAKPSTRFGRRHKPCSVCKKAHAPWWNSGKGRWFLSVEKEGGGFKQVNLGPDHDEALAKWHRLEAGLEVVETTFSAPTTTGDSLLVGELAEIFLARHESQISAERFEITQGYVNQFVAKFGGDSVAKMRVGGSDRVQAWLDAHPTWDGCVPDVVSRIKQVFNWSVKHGYISSSPVLALKKPRYGQRVNVFTAEQVDAILAVANPFFADGFRLLLLTGCRPEEICTLEAENVRDDKSGYYLLVSHKNEYKTNKPRRVFLVPEAAAIIRRLVKLYPTGRLLRSANKTSDGNRPDLSPEYFGHALRKLIESHTSLIALGLDDHKISQGGNRQYKYVAYTCRHTFAVRYLTGFYHDADDEPIVLTYQEVASLMGNTAGMVEKIYGHLVDQTEFLSSRMNGTFKKKKAK